MKFYKMHGTGNDYIYFDCMQKEIKNPNELSQKLSNRHFYIGGDGIILLCPSDIADVKMRMFNADGSEGKMCGNGIRCLGKLAHDLGYVNGNVCTVETLSGIKNLQFAFDNFGNVSAVNVDMGAPILKGDKIPSTFKCDKIVSHPLEVGDKIYNITLVNMGNPHCVIFVKNSDKLNLKKLGPKFENHPSFPERINTEFVSLIGKNHLKMCVWERGSGQTLACGTGACASAVAAVLNRYCTKNSPITVTFSGGDLTVTYTDQTVYLYGEAKLSYIGEIPLSLASSL